MFQAQCSSEITCAGKRAENADYPSRVDFIRCASCQFFLCFLTELMNRPKALSFFRLSR